eukprot:6079900-Alexandrium_andersonii.AAC.1
MPSLGCRGPVSPDGPNSPLHGEESADIGTSPHKCRSGHRRGRAERGASGARLCKARLRYLQITNHAEG